MKRMLGVVAPSFAPASVILLVVNGLAFALMLSLDGFQALLSPSQEILFRMGSLVPPLVLEGQYWRVISYGYLHIGLIHIGFNMLVLSQVGPALEGEIGTARFFSAYTLSLVGGAVADLVWRGQVLINIAGASGALFGLIGFGMSYFHFYEGPLGKSQRNFFLHWALYGFLFGFLIGADNIAHFGGFVSGAALGFLIERERLLRKRFTPVWNLVSLVCLLATAAAFVFVAIQWDRLP
jgi:rhomboid protease GluP